MAERREEDETARAGHLHRSGRQSLDCAGRLDCRCASIPRAFWSVIGGPLEGQYRNASVFHDVACDQKSQPWKTVHRMFYNAMRWSGVYEIKAKIMYYAVYNFGPRW